MDLSRFGHTLLNTKTLMVNLYASHNIVRQFIPTVSCINCGYYSSTAFWVMRKTAIIIDCRNDHRVNAVDVTIACASVVMIFAISSWEYENSSVSFSSLFMNTSQIKSIFTNNNKSSGLDELQLNSYLPRKYPAWLMFLQDPLLAPLFYHHLQTPTNYSWYQLGWIWMLKLWPQLGTTPSWYQKLSFEQLEERWMSTRTQ